MLNIDGLSGGGLLLFALAGAFGYWSCRRGLLRRLHTARKVSSGEQRFASLAAVAADAVVTIDDGNRILSWNRGAERMFGHAEAAMIGRPLNVIIPERYRARHEAGIGRICHSNALPFDGKTRQLFALRSDGGEFPIELTVSTLVGEQGRLFIGIIRDITERRQIEDSLRRAKQEAETAARARSEFLATMSHEIRTPLNGIIGLLQLLRGSRLDTAQQDWVETIHYSSQGLLAILDDLLNFSKLEAGRLELESVDFDLWRLGASITSLMNSRASEKGLVLSSQAEPEVPKHLRGDPTRLRQVLLNLVSNAIKFTDRGTVTMSVSLVGHSEDQVQLRFAVSDTGIGISEAAQARLFTPFAQADASVSRRFGGTGLGLVISKKIVTAMGGRIGVDSRPGEGSTFWFEVPFACATRMPARRRADLGRPTDPTAAVIGKVLVAEDNAINQKVAAALLADVGVAVDIVEDGHLAVAKVLGGQVAYDAVLMDVQMPVMDGLEATRRIRERIARDELPIIGLTARALPGELACCLEAGMNQTVIKPVNPEALYDALRQWTRLPIARKDADGIGQPCCAPTRSQPLPDQLPPFDIAAALKRLNGNRQLLRELIVSFRDHYGDAAAELHRLLDSGKRIDAYRIAHTLKAVAGTLEDATLFAAAGDVESALLDGSSDLADRLGILEATLDAALAAARSVGPSDDGDDEGAMPKPGGRPAHRRGAVVLIVDDDPVNIRLLNSFLQTDYEIVFATDATRGGELARDVKPDLILLDVVMPGTNGYQACERLKSDPATAHIPVIFITSLGDVDAELRGLAAGAADYVQKPFSPPVVRMRVRHQIELKQARDRLTLLADVDGLTGLANRRRFDDALDHELRRLRRSQSRLSLLLLDVDYFKAFNDTYGHVAGDDCLRRIGGVLAAHVHRSADLCARYGGEEFAAILPETDQAGATALAERVRQAVAALGIAHAHSRTGDHVTVSIGVLTVEGGWSRSASSLLSLVDAQLYKAKQDGRDCLRAAQAPVDPPPVDPPPVDPPPADLATAHP